MAARHEEGFFCEKHVSIFFLVRKGLLLLSNDDVGVATGTVFQEVRPGGGFETGDFVERKVGEGYRSKTPVINKTPQKVKTAKKGKGGSLARITPSPTKK